LGIVSQKSVSCGSQPKCGGASPFSILKSVGLVGANFIFLLTK